MLEEDAIIPEEIPTDEIEIVEELPAGSDLNVIEEPISAEEEQENEINVEEDPPDILMEEEISSDNELMGASDSQEEVSGNQSNEDVNESDPQANEEEILLNLEKIATSAEVTQANVKTGIDNLQLLSTCSLSISLMLLGGFVIYCFLNRLG